MQYNFIQPLQFLGHNPTILSNVLSESDNFPHHIDSSLQQFTQLDLDSTKVFTVTSTVQLFLVGKTTVWQFGIFC